jgi:glycosyltransferase involved in cell wall biosynthesis
VRILYHHRTQLEDAQGIHIQEIVKAFRELGHQVEMVALVRGSGRQEQDQRRKPWRWIAERVPTWIYELMEIAYNLYGFIALVQKVQRFRPHLIYERYSLNTFCGVIVARLFGIPHVLEVNSPLCLEQKRLGKLAFHWLASHTERWICSNSTHTIVVSEVLKQILQRQGVPSTKLLVMINGINPLEFRPEISGDAVREKYGLRDALVIGFVGWFRSWHGLDMLLESMVQWQLEKSPIRLLLVGDGPAYSQLREYAEANHLLPFVIFTGSIERAEMANHIAAMDVTIQPKANEYACPMKILEYMAMGRCIVAPKQPNIQEVLYDGVNASLFSPESPKHFTEALQRVLEDAPLRQTLGRAAYQTVFNRGLLWSENAKRVIHLISGSGSLSLPDSPGSNLSEIARIH